MSPGSHGESAPLAEGALQARRLGVLGGTFDPPHEGHLFAARAAKSAFHLDHVLFVPAAQAPHKVDPACASGKERVAMLALLLADEPDFSIFGGELDRPGPSYTIDTLRELRERLDPKVELFLILGADNLADFPRWRSAEEIIALAQPVVVARSGGALEASASERLSSAALAKLRMGILPVRPLDASSTELREALLRGKVPGGALPPRLREYIAARRLYLRA